MATDSYKGLRELSDRQLVAVDALMEGATQQEAADRAGVHRVTVAKWVSKHPAVQAELNRRRVELNGQRARRLRELDEAALNAVGAQLDTNDPDVALKWLKMRGLSGQVYVSPGPTEAESIIDAKFNARLEEARRQNDPLYLLTQMDRYDTIDAEQVRKQVETELESEFSDEA